MNINEAINKLKGGGARITRTRRAIVGIFLKNETPLTASELLRKLAARQIKVNKTTVYRELAFLSGKGLLCEIVLADNEVRYESSEFEHHHHLFCVRCKKIDPVKLTNDACAAAMNPPTDGFKVLGHSIEMFGVCAKCQGLK